MKTEYELWRLIESAKWTSDHDYNRISKEWSELPKEDYKQLANFINKKSGELYDKFEAAWLGSDGGPGIDVGDDSWSDLVYEVIGRGEMFYNSITVEKLRQMADDNDYEESFSYCLL